MATTGAPPQIPKTDPKTASSVTSQTSKPPASPVVASPPAPLVPPASAPAQAQIKPSLQELLEKYVSVKDLQDQSHFKCEGTCTKCGWHTLQLSQAAALTLVRQHVQQHWSDVAAQL